jgi:glutamate N-acetyltransferase/amino-acid N-acetyltransferase
MRYKGRPDLGLIVADKPCGSAGVYTRNLCPAAPVRWSRSVEGGKAILVNAGQANAQTGAAGMKDCGDGAHALAKLLDIRACHVLLASTGVIGQPLNMEAMLAALPGLYGNLSPDGLDGFSKAILTTDTRPKAFRKQVVDPSGTGYSVWGCAKGSGMISPDMATMLAFIITDRPAAGRLLKEILAGAAEKSFNRITVDGDTSTNDSVMAISSYGTNLAALDSMESPGAEQFAEAVSEICFLLARSVVEDGEGATKTVAVSVKGAETEAQALAAARSVANSPLVKTAFFGEDANWGRILCALGKSGAALDPYQVDLYLDDVHWVANGIDNGREVDAQKVMKRKSYTLTADLNLGNGKAEILTCDLSHEYVTINGSYRS